MHEDAVALDDAARGKGRRQRRDAGLDLAPGPGRPAPDEADALAMAARILGQEIRKVHDPARRRRHAAGWCGHAGSLPAHLLPIHIPAANSTTPTTPETVPCL